MVAVLKLIVLIYAAANILIGLCVTAVAIWLHAYADIHAYMTIFVTNATDSTLLAAAGILLAMGLVLTAISILGFLAALRQNLERLLVFYLVLQPIVLVLGIVCGFLSVGLYYQMHLYVKDGMLAQLNQFYSWDSKIGMAWNRVQVKKRCCGVNGPWDYLDSDWFNDQNPIDTDPNMLVPASCCVLNFGQDQQLFWTDPQQAQPKDAMRCQQDAAGKISNSGNVHMMGCYAALFQNNPDLRDYWRNISFDVTILTVMRVIQGLGLGVGFLQLIGILLTYIYMRNLNSSPRSADVSRSKQPLRSERTL